MEFIGEALTISGVSLVTVFGVLILLMLAMNLSSTILGRADRQTPQGAAVISTAVSQSKPVVQSDETDEERVAVIFAALEAAQIELPAGGRVRIEKISRRSE